MRKRLGVLCAITLLAACGTPGMLGKTDANVTQAPLAMSVVLGQIARGNGLTIRVAADVSCDDGGGSGRGGSRGGGGSSKLFQMNCTDSGEPAVPLHYNGTLSGLLDTVAYRSGTHWSYRDGVVQFTRYVTRSFQIKMMPGSSTFSASVGKKSEMKADRGASGGSGGGGSAGGVKLDFNADAKVTTESKLDYWADLVKTVSDMLSDGGRVTPSVVTSSLVVTDTAEVMERVKRYIDAENAVLGRQVKLRVQVYSVTLEENSAAGIDWNLVYQSAGGLVAGLGGPALGGALMARKGGLSVSKIPRGVLAGSTAFIKALSQQGRVSAIIDTTVVTLNNQPAPVAVTQNQGFVAQTSMTPGNYGGQAVVTAEQSVLTTGFVMNLLPTVMDNRSVMLQVQIDMSDLKKLEKINLRTGKEAPSGSDAGGKGGGGTSVSVDGKDVKVAVDGGKDEDDKGRHDDGLGTGTFMQLPLTASIQTMQRASLKSGDTLVLSGFRRKDDSTDRDGIFAYEGGTKEARQRVNEVVIVISPELTEGV